jgi:polar amino acid transport system substrate-binding protein
MPIPRFFLEKRRPAAPATGRRRALSLLLPLLLASPLIASAQTELTGLAKIQAGGTLKVAVYKDNAPFSDGPAADMKGLDVDIAAALARQMKLKLALLPFDAGENMNDDLRNMVWRGHYLGYGPAHVMLHVPVDKYLMRENRQTLIFAPYMRQYQVLLHDKRVLPDVSGPDDLKGVKLAAERGTGSASVLMGHHGGELRAQVSVYNSGVQAAQAALDGKAAGAYVMRAQAESALSNLPPEAASQWGLSPLALQGQPPNGWPLGMAIKADAKDLGEALEKALQALRESGELLALFKKHGMTLTAP